MEMCLTVNSKDFAIAVPVLLGKDHKRQSFDCGNESLNVFIKQFALQNEKNNSSKTYVIICKYTKEIVGYYTLSYGSISHEDATEQVRRRMPNYPIPVMILARLAVSKRYQRMGVGRSLLKHSVFQTFEASKIAGLKAFIVHAKDEQSKKFYLNHGFQESAIDSYHLMISIQEIKQAMLSDLDPASSAG